MTANTSTLARRIRPLAIGIALLGGSWSALASDGVGSRNIAAGVGQWIAAQGNAALRELGHDLREHIDDQIRPLLPQPADTRPLAPKEEKR